MQLGKSGLQPLREALEIAPAKSRPTPPRNPPLRPRLQLPRHRRSIRDRPLPGVEIAIVISNVADAPGLAAAKDLGLPARHFTSPKAAREKTHDADVVACLEPHNVDLVCLAGYMRLLSPEFIAAFPNRILNIHPSLLPAFPGLDAQQQAFDYGVKVAGCTVHFVDEHLDHGAIILQRAIPVLETDDAHSLAERILAEEHIAYTEAIARSPAANTRSTAAASSGASAKPIRPPPSKAKPPTRSIYRR